MKFKKIGILIGCLLIIGGLTYTFVNSQFFQGELIRYSQKQNTSHVSQKTINQNKQKQANFSGKATTEADAQTVFDNTTKKDVPVIGMMSIPAVKMVNPIINGYGETGDYLALGACTMKPNQIMGQGNYALAGHYMDSDTVFHSLNKVTKGMNVYLTDLKQIYVYQVNNVTTIDKYDVNVINDVPNQQLVTLLTCVGMQQTPYRTLVQGKLVKTIKANNANLKKYNL